MCVVSFELGKSSRVDSCARLHDIIVEMTRRSLGDEYHRRHAPSVLEEEEEEEGEQVSQYGKN